ncbi:hypothetical protein FB45DRAFT_167702 [Roridomyces roridus]|uniref:Uncharacterized protein n=1 Tax=Roridomyces roridus TaxID=1738132 RepID=A0AAD7BEH0_9AGAR|nr:hypothetical protein FB45DRAFT_167702 [Roridomyces roridus]
MENSTSCSRALMITEIVRMICEESTPTFHQGIWIRPTRLPVLARTAKIFMDPALDLIWRELASIAPLVKCMPESLWEERDERGQKTIFLRRPILAADLPRLLFYSVRVTKLCKPRYHRSGVHPDAIQALNMALSLQSFMPKLSCLQWTPVKEILPLIHQLLGCNIRTLTLDLDNTTPSLSLLPYAKASCSLVSKLTLGLSSMATQSTIAVISDAVCGWHRLQELSIPNLDLPALTHISQLESLTDLNLTAVVGDSGTLHLQPLSGPTFPSLTNLRIACDEPAFCSSFIKMISSRQLQTLSIEAVEYSALDSRGVG